MTQELAHRFGSFLTSAAGNPFGLLGRALAHWGVFFDADFSPLDGNDWVDNGDGTFTLQRSYLDEAAFKRATTGMPYNDLDLYTMGLLDPNKVKPTFVIENPTLEDGRKLRMHSSGNLVEIQNPDGSWSGPFYLPTGLKVKGTKKTISLSDITALEGERNPAFPNAQKDFKVAFVSTSNEAENPLDTLEMTRKLARFKDSFTRFFEAMARNLGNLLFPKGESTGSAPTGVSGVAADPVSALSAPLFSHPHGDSEEDLHPFEPIDLTRLRPVDFQETLAKLLPESYSLDALRDSMTQAFLSPVNLFGHLSFPPEALVPALKEAPALAAFSLSSLPVNLMTEAFESHLLKDIERPRLLSELKEENLSSLREAFPNPLASVPPLLLVNPEELRVNPSALEIPVPSPSVKPQKAPKIDIRNPQSNTTPLIWGAWDMSSDKIEGKDRKREREKGRILTRSRKKQVSYPI